MRTVDVECRPMVTAPGGGPFLTTPVMRATVSPSGSTGGVTGGGGVGRGGGVGMRPDGGADREGAGAHSGGGAGGIGPRSCGGRCRGGGKRRCWGGAGRGGGAAGDCGLGQGAVPETGRAGATCATCNFCVVIRNVSGGPSGAPRVIRTSSSIGTELARLPST